MLLRLFVWHEHGTPPLRSEIAEGVTLADRPESACWLLRVQGQLLDIEDPALVTQGPAHVSNTVVMPPTPLVAPAARCFTNVVSSVIVHIDPAGGVASSASSSSSSSLQAASSSAAGKKAVDDGVELLEWRKHSARALADGFEIRRRAVGSGAVRARIHIYLDHSPPRYRLSAPLSTLLGLPLYSHLPSTAPTSLAPAAATAAPHPATPSSAATAEPVTVTHPNFETLNAVVAALWAYIKRNNLQDARDPTVLRCDDALFNVRLAHASAHVLALRWPCGWIG
jgi:chromatin remodeling complex protein RSC6